jgi:hypothetical protein
MLVLHDDAKREYAYCPAQGSGGFDSIVASSLFFVAQCIASRHRRIKDLSFVI